MSKRQDIVNRLIARGKLPAQRRPSFTPQPCEHEGRELTGLERTGLNLDHRRKWIECEHPDKPLGPNVCHCRGCGPNCPGYQSQ